MTRYNLDVSLDPALTEVNGQVRISYMNRTGIPLDIIYLHLFPNLWDGGMRIKNVRVDGAPALTTMPSGDDILGINLPQTLQPGDAVELSMDFRVPVPEGQGVGNYGDFAHVDDVLALAHFYPTVAVHDADGWRLETPSTQGDVIYHDASLYDVTLTAPEDLVVVGTGDTMSKTANKDGSATWHLAGSPMRDFNIVASPVYRSASTSAGDVKVTSYFLPDDAKAGKEALDWAATALQTYESAFGPYPYHELDVVETGTSAGGIEYPGLIVVAKSLYENPDRRDFFESATAHEVAHQWWYNVVGNDQLNDPWLDEALAQYSTYLYFQDSYGDPGGQAFLDSLDRRWARVSYAEKPVGLSVGSYEGPEYGAIVYGRGPLFLMALRDAVGPDKMAELLRRYYAQYAWKIAQPEEFQALAEQVSGQDLDGLFDEWVYAK